MAWRIHTRCNDMVEARLVTDIGRRIMALRLAGGANLLYVRESEAVGPGEASAGGARGSATWVAR